MSLRFSTSVCISTSTVMAMRIVPVCPKCAVVKKFGELSCCASNGDWFRKCGNSGNSKTEHTWFERMQTCKDVVSLLPGKAEEQFVTPVNQATNIKQLNNGEHKTIDSTAAAVHEVPTGNSKDHHGILVSISIVLFIVILNIQTYR